MQRTITIRGAGLAVLMLWPLAAGPARAVPGETPSAPPAAPQPAPKAATPEEKAARNRAQAEEAYAQGREAVDAGSAAIEEARALKAAGDAASLKKAQPLRESAVRSFRKAIDLFKKAVRLAPDNHEAWNMLGYSYRKTGQMGEAFQAYDQALKLVPDYEPAREYRGEAYLMVGNVEKAKEELAWLQARKSDEAKPLEQALARYAAGDSTSLGLGW